MTLRRGKPTPNAEGLVSLEGVFETIGDHGATRTELSSDVSGFAADQRVWDILREVNLWEPFARDFPGTLNGYEQFAVWVSLVEHKVNYRR